MASTPLDALNIGLNNDFGPTLEIWVANAGDTVVEDSHHGSLTATSSGYAASDLAQIQMLLAQVSDFVDLSFQLVDDRATADIEIFFDPNLAVNTGNYGWTGWDADNQNIYLALNGTVDELVSGSWFYTLFLHELGHSLALEHPFSTDNGTDVIQGYSWDNYLADYNLNQGMYTVMTYGWWRYQSWSDPDISFWSHPETFGTLDIAALQRLYGSNTNYASGDDTYVLTDHGSYRTIWDTGGKDKIVYSGLVDAHIDLRPATLLYEDGGGGFLSFSNANNSNYGRASFAIAAGVSIEDAYGGAGDDWLHGNDQSNVLMGDLGDDTLYGGGGNDRLFGGGGNDRLFGGGGNDLLFGGAGNDRLYMDAGNDTLDGGSGTDWLFVTGSTNSVVNLAKTTGQNTGYGTDIIKNIENASGGSGDDRFYGNGANNKLMGNNGNDLLSGRNGNDVLIGGTGNDRMLGGAGNDRYYVDSTKDRVYETTSTSGTNTTDAGGTDRIYSTVGLNMNAYNGVKHVEHLTLQGSGNLYGYGNDNNNTIVGNVGNNTLKGGAGNDTLRGNAGADRFEGGSGRDFMYSGVDDDRDLFIFRSVDETVKGSQRDRIYQFDSGEDDIHLRSIDANTSLDGDQNFVFSSNGAAANSIWVQNSGSDVLVRGDVNGDFIHDFEILVASVDDLYPYDFIL